MKKMAGLLLLCCVGCGGRDEGGSGPDEHGPDQGPPSSEVPVEALESARGASPLADIKGNGGDVVVCFKTLEIRDRVRAELIANRNAPHPVNPFTAPEVLAGIDSLEIFDSYEYRLPIGFPPRRRELVDMGGATFQEFLPRHLAVIKEKTGFGAVIEQTLGELPFESWTASPGVVDIDDSDHAIILPNDCLLVQIAVRQDNRLYYDEILFSKLDELNRLALVFHELVYKIAADAGQNNSRFARQAVGLILSRDEFESLKPYDLHKKLLTIGPFPFPYQVAGQIMRVARVDGETTGGEPLELFLASRTVLRIGDTAYEVGPGDAPAIERDESLAVTAVRAKLTHPELATADVVRVSLAGEEIQALDDFRGDRRLYAAGQWWSGVHSVELDGLLPTVIQPKSDMRFMSPIGQLTASGPVTFFPGTSDIESVGSSSGEPMLAYGPLHVGGTLEFYPSGSLRLCSYCSEAMDTFDDYYVLPEHMVRIWISGARVSFYENGEIERVEIGDRDEDKNELNWMVGDSWYGAMNVGTVEFEPGNLLKRIHFANRNGSVTADRDGSGVVRHHVGEVTLEVDGEGRIIWP